MADFSVDFVIASYDAITNNTFNMYHNELGEDQDESKTNAYLDKELNTMSDNSCKFISFQGVNAHTSGWAKLGILYKRGNEYAAILAFGYTTRSSERESIIFKSKWFQWSNWRFITVNDF